MNTGQNFTSNKINQTASTEQQERQAARSYFNKFLEMSLSELFGLFLAFGEDRLKSAAKKQTQSAAAKAMVWRPPKAHEFSNRLAVLDVIEQYHQMHGRAQIALKQRATYH
ncbi:MAG: hypothetical protein ABI177_10280 [Edaphobacter sp.]